MLTAVLALVCRIPQAPDVTLTISAARVPIVLEAIGAQMGRKLVADPVMAKEVIAIRVTSAPADYVLAHLAEAVAGEWVAHKTYTQLVPSMAAAAKDERKRLSERMAMALKAIDGIGPPADPLRDEDLVKAADETRVKQADGEDASAGLTEIGGKAREDLLPSLIRLVPPESYAALPRDGRMVFASHPTAAQSPLPSEARAVIARFYREQSQIDRYISPLAALTDGNGAPPRLADRIANVELAVHYHGFSLSPTFDLNLVDRRGQILATNQSSSDGWFGGLLPEAQIKSSKSVPAKLRSDDQDLIRLIFPIGPAVISDARREQLLSKLKDPLRYEPLAPAGNLFLQIAANAHANLIADISDWHMAAFALNGGNDLGNFEAEVSGFSNTSTTADWIVVRPRNCVEAREDRIDRSATVRAFQEVLAADGLSIDTRAEWSRSDQRRWPQFGWDMFYLVALESEHGRNGESFISDVLNSNPSGIRIYAELSSDQRVRLRTDGVRIWELNPEARRQLKLALYRPLRGTNSPATDSEPTDILPNGIPQAGTLHISDETESLSVVPVKRVGTREVGEREPMSADKLGSALAIGDAGEYRRFRLVRIHRLTLQADYGVMSQSWPLSETFYLPKPITRFEDLPAQFRTEAEAARQRSLRENDVADAPEKKPPPER